MQECMCAVSKHVTYGISMQPYTKQCVFLLSFSLPSALSIYTQDLWCTGDKEIPNILQKSKSVHDLVQKLSLTMISVKPELRSRVLSRMNFQDAMWTEHGETAQRWLRISPPGGQILGANLHSRFSWLNQCLSPSWSTEIAHCKFCLFLNLLHYLAKSLSLVNTL